MRTNWIPVLFLPQNSVFIIKKINIYINISPQIVTCTINSEMKEIKRFIVDREKVSFSRFKEA